MLNQVSYRPISFGRIKEEYKSTDMKVREIMREKLEDTFGSEYAYSYQMGHMSEEDVKNKLNQKCNDVYIKSDYQNKFDLNKDIKVDFNEMKKTRNSSLRERIKNELYTGRTLAYEPEILDIYKKAGIKTIISLVPSSDYKDLAEANGLNYTQLNDIGEGSLRLFNYDCVKELVDDPSLYADYKSRPVRDLKKFINILNGEDKNLPYPIYAGCQYGTDRTFEWMSIYNILKDQPQNEPIPDNKVKELKELLALIEDAHRW